LIEELIEEIQNEDWEEVKALAQDIADNEQKIGHHGKRADGIVKGMLQHSRTASNEKELTDINALADEYLRLAFHGLRAKDKSFNADFKTNLDASLPHVQVIPQDIGRVLLNLINNAFYAVAKKASEQNDPDYKPEVSIHSRKRSDGIEIRVKDNGDGIPEEIREKIFQPFFTTKATGEGTGLGLSLSYEIITKGHGGRLEVESKTADGASGEETGTEFIIVLNDA
jgi:signal transduction histidine kinase